jgi:hypothetical protein
MDVLIVVDLEGFGEGCLTRDAEVKRAFGIGA